MLPRDLHSSPGQFELVCVAARGLSTASRLRETWCAQRSARSWLLGYYTHLSLAGRHKETARGQRLSSRPLQLLYAAACKRNHKCFLVSYPGSA